MGPAMAITDIAATIVAVRVDHDLMKNLRFRCISRTVPTI
jgi:hypothetical protein